jgi:hypothetical protein
MAVKRKTTGQAQRSPRSRQMDANVWMERAQAIQNYSSALKSADEKAYEFYSVANEQLKRHFEMNRRLYLFSIFAVMILLLVSIAFAILSNGKNEFFQNFSIILAVCATVLLVILLVRSPLIQAHRLLEKNLRVNVAFLSFVRRLQQSDLALRVVFMQTESQDFAKVLMQIQDFQNIVDQTSEELAEIMQE